ncbi:MAG: Y-family DNA polymerase [Chitinophagales bacterium]
MFALVDINGAFVSMEYVFRPGDRNKPGVVLSNGDGCIIAANKIAKSLPGFEMYKPAFEMEEVLKKYNVLRFSPNFELYVDMSRRFIEELKCFTDKVEMYSIDEAFLDMDFLNVDYTEYGHTIRKTILKNLDLPVGIGIAESKALCKVASKVAKKFIERTNGVYAIDTDEKRIKALKWLKIEDVWGIGRRYAKKLQAMGIRTAYQFTELTDSWVLRNMTVVGLRLKHELQGISCLSLSEVHEPKKEIGTAKSFGSMLSDYDLIKEACSSYTEYCAGKLRRQDSVASAIIVGLETNPFRTQDTQYFKRTVVTLPVPSSDTAFLIKHAIEGLERIFRPNLKYKRVSVSLVGIFPDNNIQGNLFVETNPKTIKLQKAVDFLNMKYEQGTVRLASSGYNRQHWESKAALRSSRYTTRLNEILNLGEDVLALQFKG